MATGPADNGLDPERVLVALEHPTFGPQLKALGVRDLSTFGGADVYVPDGRERIARQLAIESWKRPSPVYSLQATSSRLSFAANSVRGC
jgi:hypothetical protein